MSSNYGYQNEYDFITLFNDKYFYELDEKSRLFLKELFGNSVDLESKIQAWKNKTNQKTDIYIRHKNYIKGISLKCGRNNSIHTESIQDFERYLKQLSIPYKTIDKYVSYHYGYKRDEYGNTDYSQLLNAEEYKQLYQNEIDIFNDSINKTRIIIDMVERFILIGRNSDYSVDALISGTVDDYVWIMKDDLYDLILSKRNWSFTSPHAACMIIGPKKRCISGDNNFKDRYLVSVKWNSIKEDIVDFYNNKR